MASIAAKDLCVEFPGIGITRSFRHELLVNKVGGLFNTELKGARKTVVKVSAIRDLSFKLEAGDRLGLIGHNGAGKSTLLRTLAGCYIPTGGTLDVEGQVMPILSLGAGMDMDFSGRENIRLYGLHLGLSHREIEERIQDIAEFTELGNFLDLPVRTYSSGMMLRLSFGIVTSVQPDILLVDEVFGAGDAQFYDKAKARMEALLEQSSLLVMATHSGALIQQYCNKALVLAEGREIFFGGAQEGIDFYNAWVAEGSKPPEPVPAPEEAA